VTWDVTSFVKGQAAGDGVVSLMLRDSSKTTRLAQFDSRQGANVPTLVVN
jgi:hypothetical protein